MPKSTSQKSIPTKNDPGWINSQEAAKRIGITVRTLYKFIDEGRLPAYRFGRVIRLRVDDLNDFIESCRVRPGSLKKLYDYPKKSPQKSAAQR